MKRAQKNMSSKGKGGLGMVAVGNGFGVVQLNACSHLGVGVEGSLLHLHLELALFFLKTPGPTFPKPWLKSLAEMTSPTQVWLSQYIFQVCHGLWTSSAVSFCCN